MTQLRLGFAGTSPYAAACAEALSEDPRITFSWVMTANAKPVGKKKVVTPTPVADWAKQKHLPTLLVEKRIDDTVKDTIASLPPIDFLIVVDFGYLIPPWLLATPTIAPLNIHPSALPAWRGSSPGQFCLLFGQPTSAITLMVMNEGLDTGPTLLQLPFPVDPVWDAPAYYRHAFSLLIPKLAESLFAIADKKMLPHNQPTLSPTPLARKLHKDDGFIDWSLLSSLMDHTALDVGQTSTLLQQAQQQSGNWPTTLAQALKAFTPWPGVWTIIPTTHGPKRMQLLSLTSDQQEIRLETVKIEGHTKTRWAESKNSIKQR